MTLNGTTYKIVYRHERGLNMDDGSRLLIGSIISIIFILLKAFVTVCETAVVEVNDTKLKKSAENNSSAKRLVKLLSKPNRLLISLSVFRALTTVSVAIVLTLTFYKTLNEAFAFTNLRHEWTALISVVIIILASTILLSIFGDNIPKKIAQHNSMDIAINISGFLKAVVIIVLPLSKLISVFTKAFAKLFGISDNKEKAVTEEEILLMVDAVNETGAIEESQKEMINNVFEFDDLVVSDVMTHRTNIIAVEKSSSVHDLVDLSVNEGFSRIPVYENTIDNIIGIICIKDLLILVNDSHSDLTPVSEFVRDVMYVPQTNHCGELFKEFTETKTQIAVVVDEYGGTAGLVTMEDLLESIVGNIQDEYDDEAEEQVKIDDNTYELSGTADPEEVFEELGIALPEGHYYDTMGGMFVDILGHIPSEGEHPTVTYQNVELKALEIEDRMVTKLKATIKKEKS